MLSATSIPRSLRSARIKVRSVPSSGSDTTSKAALTAYLEALRNRCSRYGVNVVTAKPGFVATAMTQCMGKLLWLISADEAARQSLALARRGTSASGFVPARWSLVAWVVRSIPSWLFRRTNV